MQPGQHIGRQVQMTNPQLPEQGVPLSSFSRGYWWHSVQDLMLRNNTPPTGVVLLELQPQAVRQNGYEGGALGLLRKMHTWGYTDVSHSGCGSLTCGSPILPE